MRARRIEVYVFTAGSGLEYLRVLKACFNYIMGGARRCLG